MFGGNFRKFATDSNGISGTFCAFALLCAWSGAAARTPATRSPAVRDLFMNASASVDRNLYERVAWFKFCSLKRLGRYARAAPRARTAQRRSTQRHALGPQSPPRRAAPRAPSESAVYGPR